MIRTLFITLIWIITYSSGHAATYYLDAASGNDINGTGEQQNPWQTLDKSRSVAMPGDVIYLQTGDYGGYQESNVKRNNFVTYQAVTGAKVHLDFISINNTSPTNSFLKFIDINIKPDWVDPCKAGATGCDDPQYSASTQSTYSKTAVPLYTNNSNFIQLIDSVIEGQSRHLTTAAVYTINSNNITISGCDISNVTHGIRFIYSGANDTASNNNIHHIAGTGINTVGTGYRNMLYENNHIHDGLYSTTEDYAPRAPGANVHGSGISIRDGNTIVRGNIIHNTGTSSGIMLYQDDVGNDYVNDNVLIENNLIYDISSLYVLRLYEAGPNVIIRNNTFVARSRYEVNDGYYQYRTAFIVHSTDDKHGTPSVSVYNNIFIGISSLSSPFITENNNIVWSYSTPNGWACTGDPGIGDNDFVYSCTYSNRSSAPLYELFPNDPHLTFENNHGLTLDFSITKSSKAFNGGSIDHQTPRSLAPLDENNFFVNGIGVTRSSIFHSVGAFEYPHQDAPLGFQQRTH